jgi:hypothetical protein
MKHPTTAFKVIKCFYFQIWRIKQPLLPYIKKPPESKEIIKNNVEFKPPCPIILTIDKVSFKGINMKFSEPRPGMIYKTDGNK